MENKPTTDPSTPNNSANGQPQELSLADQILEMKAERDAKLKNQEAGNLQAPVSAAPEPKTSAEAQGNKVINEPGAPEASGPAETSPAPETESQPTAEVQTDLIADAPVDQLNINTTETASPAASEKIMSESTEKEIPAETKAAESTSTETPAEGKINAATDQITTEISSDLIAEPATDQPNINTTEAAATASAESDNIHTAPASAAVPVREKKSESSSDDQADEHDEHEEEHEEIDYSTYSKTQLVSEIKKFTSEAAGGKNGRKVTELFKLYQHLVREERNEALNKFTETGGEEADFVYQQTEEDAEVEKAVVSFREQKSRQAKLQEEVKTKNLQAKKELLDKLRQLVDAPEETQNSINDLKQIQSEWKAIGAVPQGESQELWNSYHALLDQYYNNRSIFNELKDLDRKRNLEAKIALCERAESLSGEESINNALMELRHLHEEWKNIGPVPSEDREPIWERFIAASEKVHERRKAYLTERKAKEESNLVSKLDVLKMVDEFGTFVTDRINDWRSKTDEIQKIKDIWEKIGLVPKEKAEEVNKRFWGAYKAFFHNKNAFFKALDDQKAENLRLKTEMCEYAESLVDNPDFAGTKEKLIQLQKKWKTIGRVPDKHSDEVWHRFRAACNAFFDKKNAEVAAKEAEKEQLVTAKRTYVNEFEQQLATDGEFTEQGLEQVLAKWRELSHGDDRTPKNVEDKFYQLVEQYIAKMPGLSDEERQDKLFQMEVASLKAHPDNSNDLYKKEQSLRKEIQTLEHSISTLKTNMEFFAKSKNADQIRNDYSARINESQQKIDDLKRRLKMLRK